MQCHFYCFHINTTEEKMSTEFKGSGSFSQICLVLPLSYIYFCSLTFIMLALLHREKKSIFHSSMTFISVSICCWDWLPWSSCSPLSYFYEYPHFLTAAGFQRESVGWHPARISLNIHHCLLSKKEINCFLVTSWMPVDGENSLSYT